MKEFNGIQSEARERLIKCGIRPSAQRVAILQYLLTHFTHPNIDEVYNSLCPVIPSLSRTTVYNTLRLFADLGAAQMITINDHHVCYDGRIEPHGHFICRSCGKVMDFFEVPNLPNVHPNRIQEGCFIDEVQVYYKGICPECQKQSN